MRPWIPRASRFMSPLGRMLSNRAKQAIGFARRHRRLTLTATMAFLSVLYGVTCFLMVQSLTSVDRKPQEDNPAKHGLAYEDVTFRSRDGLSLSGWYIPGAPNAPGIIFVPGFDSNRSGDHAVDIADRLVHQGFGALLFDLRGQGSSATTSASGGWFERFDVLGAFNYLKSRGLPASRIGVLGLSMGAASAVFAAAEEPGISALALDSPYANVTSLIADETARRTFIPRWVAPIFIPTARIMARVADGIDLGKMAPEQAIKKVPYPVLVMQGSTDTRIPLAHGQAVYRAAAPGSQLWVVDGAGHVDEFALRPDEYIQRLMTYYNERLAGKTAAAHATEAVR